MRLGLIARADNTGLGVQTKELYDHLKPHRTYVIDLTEINASMGKQTALFMDRYPDGIIVEGFPTNEQCRAMLEDIDVLLTVEIPYNYQLFELAKEMGVKTILQYNYEFLDYLQNPTLPLPDMLLAPSTWHLEDVQARFSNLCHIRHLPVPANTEYIHHRAIRQAKHFLHVAGHKTYMDRNGTETVLQAMEYVKSPIKLTIHSQGPIGIPGVPADDRITIVDTETHNYWDIYNNPNYDVMLLPRRYGGLSLQLNEALAAGMPVISTNVQPQNTFLPEECLIGVEGKEIIQTRTSIECWDGDPLQLAEKIDELHNNPKLVKYLSRQADVHTMQNSWQALLPKYNELLGWLCRQP